MEQTLGLREMLVGHVEDARGNELARQQQQEEEAACRAGRPSQYKSLSIIVDQAIRRGRVSGTRSAVCVCAGFLPVGLDDHVVSKHCEHCRHNFMLIHRL